MKMTTTAITTASSTPSARAIELFDLKAAHAELRARLDAAWRRVLDRGRFIDGPELARFEARFAALCGVAHCVGVGNGYDALRLMLQAAGVRAGDEVIVPAHTFIATWLAVSALGATPLPVDVDEESMNIDPRRVEAALSRRSRAIIAVHLYGRPAPMDALREIARRHGIALFEDAAQAHGAYTHDSPVGSLGDAAAFSFYPGKNLGALGDGGAIVTDDAELAARARRLRNYGAEQKNQHQTRGGNSRLDELQAAFLNEKLARLEAWNRRRRAVARRYDEALRGIRGLRPPSIPCQATSAWHQYVVRVRGRDALCERLRRRGIGFAIHYPTPPHRSPAYADSHGALALPVAEGLAEQVLSLPMGPHLSEADQCRVIDALRDFFPETGCRQ